MVQAAAKPTVRAEFRLERAVANGLRSQPTPGLASHTFKGENTMHLHITNISLVPFHAALLAAAMITPSVSSAASPCKGLAVDACSADTQCTWVNGYARKDGRSVVSHCKLKPSGKGSAMADDDTVKLSKAK
jgi:hypothetical protein